MSVKAWHSRRLDTDFGRNETTQAFAATSSKQVRVVGRRMLPAANWQETKLSLGKGRGRSCVLRVRRQDMTCNHSHQPARPSCSARLFNPCHILRRVRALMRIEKSFETTWMPIQESVTTMGGLGLLSQDFYLENRRPTSLESSIFRPSCTREIVRLTNPSNTLTVTGPSNNSRYCGA